VLLIWKPKFSETLIEAEQRSYAMSDPVRYPEDLQIIDCSLGTNPLGAPKCLKSLILSPDFCNLCDYPDPEPYDLKNEISCAHQAWKLSTDQILIGGGSMGILVTLARLLISKGTFLSGISPQFTDAVVQCLCNGAAYHPVQLEAPDYRISIEPLLEIMKENQCVIYLDRPNNPTGQVTALKDVEKLAAAGMENSSWIISDEAYGDYLPDEESTIMLDYPNLITCRSFSKGLGSAGLRIGYAVSNDSMLSALFRKAQPPFVLGTADALMGISVVRDREFLDKTRNYVQLAKTAVMNVLKEKEEFSVADTDIRIPILLLSQKSGNLAARLASIGISCEAGSGFFSLDDTSVRLRVPSPDKLETFLERIRIL